MAFSCGASAGAIHSPSTPPAKTRSHKTGIEQPPKAESQSLRIWATDVSRFQLRQTARMRSIARSIGAIAISGPAPAMLSAQSHPAGNTNRLAGDVGRLIGSQKQHGRGNLFGLAEAPQQGCVGHGAED